MKPAPEAARPPMLRKVRPKSEVQNLSARFSLRKTPPGLRRESCGLHGGDGGGAEDGEEEQDSVLATQPRVEQRAVQSARRDCHTQHRHTRNQNLPAELKADKAEESRKHHKHTVRMS